MTQDEQRTGRPAVLCRQCSCPIPLAAFQVVSGGSGDRVAVCPGCTASTTLAGTGAGPTSPYSSDVRAGSAPRTEVVRRGSTWLATCDCGKAEAVQSVDAGWVWILDHPCSAR